MREIRAIIKVKPSYSTDMLPKRSVMDKINIPVRIRYDHYNSTLVIPMHGYNTIREPNVIITSDKNYMMKYHNMEIEANYVGLSRIDGYPIFHVDTIQLSREEKINKLLQ